MVKRCGVLRMTMTTDVGSDFVAALLVFSMFWEKMLTEMKSSW